MPATAIRLSPLDDSFLAVESSTAHMHVGWASVFEPPAEGGRPSFEQLREHVAHRLCRAPRFRQKISPAPLGLDSPSWVDDPDFDVTRHVRPARSGDLDEIVAACMSEQLDRARPLWELRIAERLADGRIGVVGKAHHCMVDGIAAVELGSLILDPTPDAREEPEDDWSPRAAPGTVARVSRMVGARAGEQLELAGAAVRLLGSPRRWLDLSRRAAIATAGAVNRTLRPATPVSPLNEPISAARVLARADRPLADLQRVKEHFGATVNDVYLAAAAGAMRVLLEERGETPVPLKTMVPVSVREDGQLDQLGNRISFMFIDLPCDEPEPVRRLRRVQLETGRCKDDDDPGAADEVLRLVGYAPRTLRRAVAKGMASPRMFNLVVSNIPGPREPMFMHGCRLTRAYPIVPLADRHALSIGMTTIRDRACFGLYADRRSLADVGLVAAALKRATDELVELTGDPNPATPPPIWGATGTTGVALPTA
jgi:diacylglycerol O-acyltransferase / wax synthase